MPNSKQKLPNSLQVLPESFRRDPEDGTFRCHLATLQSDILFEIESLSSIDADTLEILQQAVVHSRLGKARALRSTFLLSKLPDNVSETFDHRFQLCCKILIKNATNLLDGLPFNRKNFFDRCAVHPSPTTYQAWKPVDFYEHVHVPDTGKAPFDFQSAGHPLKALTCQLYPFQKRALQWLLLREGVQISGNSIVKSNPNRRHPMHLL